MVDPEQLGVFGALLGGDQPASAEKTRQLVDWKPTGPTPVRAAKSSAVSETLDMWINGNG